MDKERVDFDVGKIASVDCYLFAESEVKSELHSVHEEENAADKGQGTCD